MHKLVRHNMEQMQLRLLDFVATNYQIKERSTYQILNYCLREIYYLCRPDNCLARHHGLSDISILIRCLANTAS